MRSSLTCAVASLAALTLLAGGSTARATAVKGATSAIATTQTLTVSKAGDGSGTISSRPAGIVCGSTCSFAFPSGTVVTLGVGEDEDSNSTFSGWSGACSGADRCQLTMNADKSVTATFVLDTDTTNTTETTTTQTTTTTSGGGRSGSTPGCVVPKVTGKKLTAAKAAIKKAKCAVGNVTKKASAKVKKGRVISQKPSPGKHLAKGSKVNLVVSKGKKRS